MLAKEELLELREWRGTAEDLTHELKRTILSLGLKVTHPSVRTIRLWRARHLLTQPASQDYTYRQILEGLGTALLLSKGWTLAAIGELLPSLKDAAIEANVLTEAAGVQLSWIGITERQKAVRGALKKRHIQDMAEEAVVLLAQGVLRQYDRTLNNEIVRQDDGIPPELQSAMCRIGRIYIEEGKEDRAACVHDILDLARYSFDASEWGLTVFRDPDFRFGQAILIDPELRVPTTDCSVIAKVARGFGEENLLEYRFHTQLRETAERCGRLRDMAYTAIRELIGRRSLISEREFINWLEENALTPLQQSILDVFFQPVQELWLIDRRAHRCGHCGTLMRPHPNREAFSQGCCPIRQCNRKFSPMVIERLDPQAGLHVAKPQILTYWTGPAVDELAIYDEAIKRGLPAELYPETDLCDVGIGARAIGIDAKSYTSPVSLALHLNRSIGGLVNYRRRIIAVGDEHIHINPNYLSILRSSLDKRGDLSTLEIMSVTSVINMLRSGKHAKRT